MSLVGNTSTLHAYAGWGVCGLCAHFGTWRCLLTQPQRGSNLCVVLYSLCPLVRVRNGSRMLRGARRVFADDR